MLNQRIIGRPFHETITSQPFQRLPWLALIACLALQVEAFAEWADPERVAAVEEGEITEARADWWGFDPDDATRYLQAAFDSNARKVIVPDMDEPWVVEPLTIERDNLEVVFEPGVLLMARADSFYGRNDCLLSIWDQSDITLTGYGATFRMRKADYQSDAYRDAQWRHTLELRGASNVTVEGFAFEDSGGDGVYIGRGNESDYCENILVRDIVSDNNHRQGMSVVSVQDLLVERSVFQNTRGTAPMAGIDAETHRPEERLANVVIRNCVFLDNALLGIHNWPSDQTEASAPISVTWEGNYVRGGAVGIHVASLKDETPPGEMIFRDNIVEGSHFAGIMIRRWSAEPDFRLEFSNNVLIHTGREDYREDDAAWFREQYDGLLQNSGDWYARHGVPAAPIIITAQGESNAWQGNISFDNDLIISDLDSPMVVIQGPWGVDHEEMFGRDPQETEEQFLGWRNITGTLRAVNPYGAEIDVRTPVENMTLQID